MESEKVKVEISSTTRSQAPSLGLTSTVLFTIQLIHEEFMGDNLLSRKASSLFPHKPSPLSLKFSDFTPNHILQILNLSLHDHFLSQKLCDHIVGEAQRFLSPPTKLPLTMEVNVEVTQKVVYHLPTMVAPPPTTTTTDCESESEKLETETCSICLEDLSSADSKCEALCQLPYCGHLFHEVCVIKWLEHAKNSCPLCRQSINKQS